MKRLVFASMMVFVILLVSGCSNVGSYSFINSQEKSENNSWSASYDKFNGYKQREITLTGEDEHTFIVEVVTNSGTIGLSIKDKDGKSFYTGKEMPSSSFEVIVDKEGTYIIRLDVDNHSGGFDIKWE